MHCEKCDAHSLNFELIKVDDDIGQALFLELILLD